MNKSQSGTILIVDDETDLRTLVEYNLNQAGYATKHASTGAEALARIKDEPPRAIILDLNLPDVSGTDICRMLKTDPATRTIPIIMLTARSSEPDRILGFELGADDYVCKPFSVRELLLRLEAILRRGTVSKSSKDQPVTVGPITLDHGLHEVRVKGEVVPLTLQEFRLLDFLVSANGRVCSREQLLQDVWQSSPDLETRTVDTHVKRLRDKLLSAGDWIETIRGVGYRIKKV